MSLREKLAVQARSLGFDAVGIAGAEPFTFASAFLSARRARGGTCAVEHAERLNRVDPRRLLPGARSIVSVAVAYSRPADVDVPRDRRARGRISCHAWGEDYHHVLGRRLRRLAAWLCRELPGARTRPFVDTGPPLDRAVAVRAGVGWQGKHTGVIHPRLGSWIFLGTLLTDADLPADEPLVQDCGSCHLCQRTCPTDALAEAYRLDANRCLAMQTLAGGSLPEEVREEMGRELYGCDICQAVCPHNRAVEPAGAPAFTADPQLAYPDLAWFAGLSNRAFRRAYGGSSAAWRGRTPLQRNAVVAMGNLRRPASVQILAQLLDQDARAIIRGHAAWSLGRFAGEPGGAAAARALAAALAQETEAEVRREIRAALARHTDRPGA